MQIVLPAFGCQHEWNFHFRSYILTTHRPVTSLRAASTVCLATTGTKSAEQIFNVKRNLAGISG